jgi:hypothetical protein
MDPFLERASELIQDLASRTRDGDDGTLTMQRSHDGSAYCAGCAGNERRLPAQIKHRSLLH